MSTPEVRNNRTDVERVGHAPAAQPDAEPAERPGHDAAERASRRKMRRLTLASCIIGAVAAVGLLVTLFGAYVVEEDSVVVAGTIIITSAAIAWIVGTVIMAVLISGPLFSAFRKILLPLRLR